MSLQIDNANYVKLIIYVCNAQPIMLVIVFNVKMGIIHLMEHALFVMKTAQIAYRPTDVQSVKMGTSKLSILLSVTV